MFKRSNFVAFSLLAMLTLFVLSACVEASENPFGTTTPVPATDTPSADSGNNEPVAAGPDLANGESKFKGLGCSSCHSTGDNKLVGPGLSGINSKGDDYIRTSITDPGAVIVDGYSNLMPTSFSGLKQSDLDDLVGYLNTLN